MSVKVQVNILMCHGHPVAIIELAIDYNHRMKIQSRLPGVIIEIFSINSRKSCLKYSQSAIKCIILTDFFTVLI